MKIINLERRIKTCGKEFIIDNFFEVKKHIKSQSSRTDLTAIIIAKDRWKEVSAKSLQNRISITKMIIQNHQTENALKIIINSNLSNNFKIKAKEIFELELGRKFDENKDKLEMIINSDSDTFEDVYNIENSKMNIPLNQIFYGPPGTGKTYGISREAERIINNNISEDLDLEQKFSRIVSFIRSEYDEDIYNKLNGNTIYRNFKIPMVIMGYFLDQKYDSTNTIIHKDLKDQIGFLRSGWSQRVRYLTEFGFIEGDWKEKFSRSVGYDMSLSESGKEFKQNLKSYIEKENIDVEDLKSWTKDRGLPEIVINTYVNILKEISPLSKNMTAFKKTICCALYMCLQGKLFKQKNENDKLTAEEIELVEGYLDINNSKGINDYKWIGWIAANLEGLNLVELIPEKRFDKYYYTLTDAGRNLIEEIVNRWESERSSLFNKEINYETGIELGLVDFITFHQSYSYEEFIEGIRPNLNEDELSYSLEEGVFQKISNRAKGQQDKNFVLIIDEINRGNISKIFGELITLIEPSKRLLTENDEHPKRVTLPYSKKLFGIPKNLYILGTMNTADKSIALLDSALRRRFSFNEMLPSSDVVDKLIKIEGIDIKLLFETINSRIEFLIDKDHMIGHSYFLKIKENPSIQALALIFKKEIIPLLTEYFYGDFEKIQLVLGDNKEWKSKSENKFFNIKMSQQKKLFGKDEVVDGYDEKIIYELNEDLFGQEDEKINGKSEELIKLFKSVYSQQSIK